MYIMKSGTEIHFDIKDYPTIFYINLEDLEERLRKRIQGLEKS